MIFIFSVLSSKIHNDVPENIKNSQLKSGDYRVIKHFDHFNSVYVAKMVKNDVTNLYEENSEEIIQEALKNSSK